MAGNAGLLVKSKNVLHCKGVIDILGTFSWSKNKKPYPKWKCQIETGGIWHVLKTHNNVN
jgi:hypothetical protein